MENIKKYSITTYLKFILFSAFGIFSFFIDITFPAYSVKLGIFSFEVAESTTNLVAHLTNFIKGALWTGSFKVMPYIVWIVVIFGMIDLYLKRKKNFATKIAALFSIFRIIGFVLLTMIIFNFGPTILHTPISSLGGKSIGTFVLNNILISITISIPAASLFLPFLLDYGLVDFIGVLVRPIMRPVLKLPGRAAVIAVSAFLGNFSVGHIAVNDEYKTGKMTNRESVVIGTSLSTVSVAFLLVLAQNTNMLGHWNLYFWTAFLITILVTLIGVRLYPLSKLPDTYYEGAEPNPERVYNDGLLKNAYIEAMNVAESAENPFARIVHMEKETLSVLGTITSGSTFFSAAGVILFTYTPIFKYIGYIFYPIISIFIPGPETLTASTGAAISLLEVTIPALLVANGEWSLRIRYMLAVIPVTSIIFLASFVPCIMGTEIPVKFKDLLIIWFERMVLSLIITGIFAMLLFPAGAV